MMKNYFFLGIFFIFLSQWSTCVAYSQNYIFEFPYSVGGGTRNTKMDPEYLNVYYAYTDDINDTNITAEIFKRLHLTEADVGETFIIYPYDNYPSLVTFVDNLTNGINDRLQIAESFCDIAGGASVADESYFFGHLTQNGIDFEGYEINNISLYIKSLSIDFDGINWYEYHIDSKFLFDVTLIDADLNGIPDNQEVYEYSDLDGNGVNDSAQEDMRCLYTINGESEICIKIPQKVSSLGLIRTIEPELIDDNSQKPEKFPSGLLSFRMEVEKGATVTVPIYFSQKIPLGSEWYKYDPRTGWSSCSDFTIFASDRKSVLLTLTDGGSGDIDGIANSIIINLSGPAITKSGEQIVDLVCPCYRKPAWKNHGQYESCVVKEARDQFNGGFITRSERRAFVSERSRNDCGKKKKNK